MGGREMGRFDRPARVLEIGLGGELMRVIVFGMVLGYSRRKHYTASLDEDPGLDLRSDRELPPLLRRRC